MRTNRSTSVVSGAPARSFEGVLAGVVAIVLIDLALAGSAQAYVGPGAGLTAIGTVLALFAAVSLAVVGFVWYPIRRLRRRRRSESAQQMDSRAGKPS
jgi:peptidoglycan/LPS O-acetylase OafA/YrhL